MFTVEWTYWQWIWFVWQSQWNVLFGNERNWHPMITHVIWQAYWWATIWTEKIVLSFSSKDLRYLWHCRSRMHFHGFQQSKHLRIFMTEWLIQVLLDPLKSIISSHSLTSRLEGKQDLINCHDDLSEAVLWGLAILLKATANMLTVSETCCLTRFVDCWAGVWLSVETERVCNEL